MRRRSAGLLLAALATLAAALAAAALTAAAAAPGSSRTAGTDSNVSAVTFMYPHWYFSAHFHSEKAPLVHQKAVFIQKLTVGELPAQVGAWNLNLHQILHLD